MAWRRQRQHQVTGGAERVRLWLRQRCGVRLHGDNSKVADETKRRESGSTPLLGLRIYLQCRVTKENRSSADRAQAHHSAAGVGCGERRAGSRAQAEGRSEKSAQGVQLATAHYQLSEAKCIYFFLFLTNLRRCQVHMPLVNVDFSHRSARRRPVAEGWHKNDGSLHSV